MDETFTLLPITMDPTSKTLTSPATDLTPLNALHRTLLSLPHQTPPPPTTTNPKRSAQIQKMREQGNTSLRTHHKTPPTPAQAHDAIKLYTYGLEMALGRPAWEPHALVTDEAALLYANRAQAHMAAHMWPEGASDAETSVELKKGGNGKAWWRRGKCLCEMGRWEEARGWVGRGLEVEGNEGELGGLWREIGERLEVGGAGGSKGAS